LEIHAQCHGDITASWLLALHLFFAEGLDTYFFLIKNNV